MRTSEEDRQKYIDDPSVPLTHDFGAEIVLELARDAQTAAEALTLLRYLRVVVADSMNTGRWRFSAEKLSRIDALLEQEDA